MTDQSLLCTETNVEAEDDRTHQEDCENVVGSGSEPLVCFVPLQSDEILCLMFEREHELLPRGDFLQRLRSGDLDLCVRKEALDWVYKAHAHYKFGALSVCLAVNYLDRFLSLYELPRGKKWTVQLLAVACLSLAAKMEEVNVPVSVDLQVADPKFVFESKTIKRMELLVLSTLKWRMQACTPCSFIDYYLRKINDVDMLPFPSGSLINRSIQFILRTMKGIDFLEFRPSEISAAVAICVTKEMQTVDINKAMARIIHVEKDRVMKCIEMIQDLTLSTETSNGRTGTTQVPQSPNGVLDAACLSYKSDERTVGSCPNSSSHTTSPDTKRRRLD